MAHSTGLLADAGHNITDVAGIAMSLVAVRFALRPRSPEHSFGYHRGTILAALANAAIIAAVTVAIVVVGVDRFSTPRPWRAAWWWAWPSVLRRERLAALVLRQDGRDLNMRAAALHMAADAVASLVVAAAGAVVLVDPHLRRADPVASLAVGALIIIEAYRLLRASLDVLLESAPADVDLAALTGAMATVTGVAEVHDLHVWSLSSEVRALSAHVVRGRPPHARRGPGSSATGSRRPWPSRSPSPTPPSSSSVNGAATRSPTPASWIPCPFRPPPPVTEAGPVGPPSPARSSPAPGGVAGRVQGVGFRYSCRHAPWGPGSAGWVRNLPDGRVEAAFEGPGSAVDALVAWCRVGPPMASVTAVAVTEEPQGEPPFPSADRPVDNLTAHSASPDVPLHRTYRLTGSTASPEAQPQRRRRARPGGGGGTSRGCRTQARASTPSTTRGPGREK